MKVVVLIPRAYSGGVIVLSEFCRELQAEGINARIFIARGRWQREPILRYWIKWAVFSVRDELWHILFYISGIVTMGKKWLFSDLFMHLFDGCKRKWLPFCDKDTIVVYPDTYYGNILNASKVVRWLLYFNRFPGDENAYGKNDLFFCFREKFNDYSLNPDCRELRLNSFDLQLYKRTNFGERHGVCYVVRKGKDRKDLPTSFDGPVIDSWAEAEKVKVFNRCERCYLYDTQTAYAAIAAICGCLPIVVPEPGKSRRDYLGKGDENPGVAYGESPEEIAYALRTREQCLERIHKAMAQNREAVKYFIKTCEAYFGKGQENQKKKS